jgi:hypothetical protein
MDLVIADVDEDGLADAVDELTATGIGVVPVRAVVSDRGEVDAILETALRHFDTVNLVCNNGRIAWTDALQPAGSRAQSASATGA